MTESDKGCPTSDIIAIGRHAQKSLYSPEGQAHVKRFRMVTTNRWCVKACLFYLIKLFIFKENTAGIGSKKKADPSPGSVHTALK